MTELHQDHQHISTLLTILKNKLVTLKTGGQPNLELFAELVAYLRDYADGYHHVKEDIILSKMLERHPELGKQINRLFDDHCRLRELTLRLENEIQTLDMSQPDRIKAFIRLLGTFIEQQSQHLQSEEQDVFPLVEQAFSHDDWVAIQKEMPVRADPLFGNDQPKEYERLREAMLEDLCP